LGFFGLWVASKTHEEKFSREKTSLNRDVIYNRIFILKRVSNLERQIFIKSVNLDNIMQWLRRKNGIILCTIGIAIFLLNFLTYSLWEIDIDILGLIIFILGLVIAIACGPSMKDSSKLLTRKNGVRLCVITIIITALFAYSPIPYLNGDFGGFLGLTIFIFGIIIIAVRWKY